MSSSMREDWTEIIYRDAVYKVSTSLQKLKQKQYLKAGTIPIVDQGQDLIGGYTNDEKKIIDCDLPVIVFGDHTKIIKLIDFQFAPGADGTKILEPSKFVLPKFLSLLTKILVFKIKDNGYARHYQHIEKEYLPLAPLPIQRAIVSKIEALFSDLDNGIANFKKAQEQLKIYRQAVLKKAFEGELTKEWREKQTNLPTAEELLKQIKEERLNHYNQQIEDWKKAIKEWEKNGKKEKKPTKPVKFIDFDIADFLKLENLPFSGCKLTLAQLKTYSIYGPRFSSKDYVEDGVAVLRTSDISDNGKVDWLNAPKLPISDFDYQKYKLIKNDLLITRTGSIGRISIFNDNKKAIPGAFLIHYRLLETIHIWYIFHFLKSRVAQKHLIENSAGIGRPNLNVPNIEKLYIPICSFEEQNQIVQEIESRLSVCDKVEQSISESLEKAEALRQSILKKAFEGKLLSESEIEQCKQAADYEPASELLKKIKAEKLAKEQEKKKTTTKKKSKK